MLGIVTDGATTSASRRPPATATACAKRSSAPSAGGCTRSGPSTGQQPPRAGPAADGGTGGGAATPAGGARARRPRRREPDADADDEERERRERPLIDVREDPTALPWVSTYDECASLRPRRRALRVRRLVNNREQVEMVIEVANVEAPVHSTSWPATLPTPTGSTESPRTSRRTVKRAVRDGGATGAVELPWRVRLAARAAHAARSGLRIPDDRDAPRLSEIAGLELTSAVVRMRT